MLISSLAPPAPPLPWLLLATIADSYRSASLPVLLKSSPPTPAAQCSSPKQCPRRSSPGQSSICRRTAEWSLPLLTIPPTSTGSRLKRRGAAAPRLKQPPRLKNLSTLISPNGSQSLLRRAFLMAQSAVTRSRLVLTSISIVCEV